MSKKLSPWAIAGIALGGVAVVATGVVVAVKILDKKKKKRERDRERVFASLSDEQLDSILPDTANKTTSKTELDPLPPL